MTRRKFLVASAAAGVTSRFAGSKDAIAIPQGAARTTMGVCIYSFGYGQRGKSTIEFLEYCAALGAGGVQVELSSFEPDYVKKVRERVEKLGMYLEIITELPKADTAAFERTIVAAKEAGAICVRSACLSGRRYEAFSSLDEWNRFVSDSNTKIARAVSILEKHRVTMGIENHKDWTTDEMVALMKQYSSEYFGVCLDTGNNISLLDDPMDVVERLAPYAVSTHIKDMEVREYPEGFLLSEVPLGEGMLDMMRIVAAIARSRPRIRFTLEMITRNPLKVPCLSDKYWTTFPDRNGKFLARALSMVRAHKPGRALPQVESMEPAARTQLEEENVKKCLGYARGNLRLRPPESRVIE